jgi:PAS domain S-box-containing protein
MPQPDIATLQLLGMALSLLQAVALGAHGSQRRSAPHMRRWWLGSCLVASSFVFTIAGELWRRPGKILLLLGSWLSVAGFACAYDGFRLYFHRPGKPRAWYLRMLVPVYLAFSLLSLFSERRAIMVTFAGFVTIALTLPNVQLLVGERKDGRRRALSLVSAGAFLGFVLVTLLRMAAFVTHEAFARDRSHWIHLIFASYLVVFFPTLTILLTLLHSRRTQDELNTALRVQREKAEELDRHFNSSRDLLAVLDAQGRFLRLNEEWRRDLNYDPAQLLGTELLELVVEEDRESMRSMLQTLASRAPVFNCVIRLQAVDEKPHFVEWNAQSIEGYAQLVGRDITQRTLLQEQLQQAQKMETIGQLAGGLAHDLNNSLAAIVAASDLLVRQVGANPSARRSVEVISQAALRGAELTRGLLVFSRKEKIAFNALDAHEVLHTALGLLRHSTTGTIELQEDLRADPSWVRGDPALLQSVVLNLGINARDAMPGGGTFSVSTGNETLDAASIADHGWSVRPGEFLRVDFSDTGTGMSDEVQRHMFEPFFTTKPPGKGTGLGLASVYATAERHHGAMAVHSQVAVGTTFSLYLPLAGR